MRSPHRKLYRMSKIEIIMKDVVGAKNNEARYIIPFKNLDVILNISRINYAFNEILRNYHVN